MQKKSLLQIASNKICNKNLCYIEVAADIFKNLRTFKFCRLIYCDAVR